MTQALLPLPNVAIPGVERCRSSEVEVPKIQECPGSSERQGPQEKARVEMVMVGESGLNPTKSKAEKIQEGLERTISDDAKERIENVLNEVNQLSDVEKLLLYLKLPTGSALASTKDGAVAPSTSTSNRFEQIQAVTWIKSHLEEDPGISLPKQEVFEDYKTYSESHGYKSLSQADFGKVMKCVFPNVKPRRLGQRGQSKHCYGGLRKKMCVRPPTLPEISLDEKLEEPKKEDASSCDDVLLAASELVCEWSQKLLNHQFGSLKDLAVYLIEHMYVNSRSMASFTVLANVGKSDTAKSTPTTATSNAPSGNPLSRHRETQLQLQRKLHEREQIKEQKRKLEQQRSAVKSRGADGSDSRSADDSSRESEKGDSSCSRTGLVGAASGKGSRNYDAARGKPQTPVTPQKLILPKMGPSQTPTTPVSSQGKPAASAVSSTTHSTVTVTTKSVPVNNSTASGPQQILVFSPTPHMNQPAQQQLVILSPINRGTGSLQNTNSQQIMPVQPVIMNTIGAQAKLSGAHGQVAPKSVNVVQVPILQTHVSSQNAPKGMTQAMTECVNISQSADRSKNLAANKNSNVVTNPANQYVAVAQISSSSSSSGVHEQNNLPPQLHSHWSQDTKGQTTSTSTSNTLSFGQELNQQKQKKKAHRQPETSVTTNSQAAGGDHSITTEPSVASTNSNVRTPTCSQTGFLGSPTPHKIMGAVDSPNNSDSASANNGTTKLTSKTVSSLLKEQRGYGPGPDNKMPYVNDRRPVSELLKDIRAKRMYGPSNTMIAHTLAQQNASGLAGTPSSNTISPSTLMLQTLSQSQLGQAMLGNTATVPSEQSPRMTAPLPIISGAGPSNAAGVEIVEQISENNNQSSLQELLAKVDNDLQSSNAVIGLSTNERLRQVLTLNSVAKKRTLTAADSLPRKRQNVGGPSENNVSPKQSVAWRTRKNSELANALTSANPPQPKVDFQEELEKQLSSSSLKDPSSFASRLARSLAQAGITDQMVKNQSKVAVKLERSNTGEVNIMNLESDALVDFFSGDGGSTDLADITPSIAQMVQTEEQDANSKLEPSIKEENSEESKSDGAYNLSEVLMKADMGDSPKILGPGQIDFINYPGNSLPITVTVQQQQQQQPPQQQQQQEMGGPSSGHTTPCPSPGVSDPRQPFINLRGDVLLSQSANTKPAQLALLQQKILQQHLQQRQFLQQQQQQQKQQQQQQQEKHNQQQRQRHRSMPDQVLRFQAAATTAAASTQQYLPQLLVSSQKGTFVVSNTPSSGNNEQVQLQQQIRSASAQGMFMVTAGQQQAIAAAAAQANPALTAQLLQNNMVLKIASEPQHQIMQQQVYNSGMTINVGGPSSNCSSNSGVVSHPQSPAQLMSPNSGSAQRSAASTPLSVLSPQTPMSHGMDHSRSIGPSPIDMNNTHGFMPIQNPLLEETSGVNVVRPTATIACTGQDSVTSTVHQQMALANASQFTTFTTEASSREPINHCQQQQQQQQQQQPASVNVLSKDEGKPPNYNLAVKQKLAQKLALQSVRNSATGKESAHFAPASSIKPVKRGGRGPGKGGASKRQRHHSAQSALGGAQSQANTADLDGMRQRSRSIHATHPESQKQRQQQQQQQKSADSLKMLGDVNMGMGPSTPESPFSPEIQDILNSGTQNPGTSNSFRSQSVPVSDLFFNYAGSSDIFSGSSAMLEPPKENELLDDLGGGGDISSLASLLQGKLQEESSLAPRGAPSLGAEGFGARRNLTELIEQRSQCLTQDVSETEVKSPPSNPNIATNNNFDFDDSNSSNSLIGFRGRGDVTLTSALLGDTRSRSTQRLSALPSHQSSLGVMHSSSLVEQNSSNIHRILTSTGPVASQSTLDSSSSMDTLNTQDSRESLVDSLFHPSYDTSSDFPHNLTGSQGMDIVGGSDFGFTQWEMGQMVHD